MQVRDLCWKLFWDAVFENSAFTADHFACGLAVAQKPLECLERQKIQDHRGPFKRQQPRLRAQPHAGLYPLRRAHAHG